jgi:hypothetical protein
MPHAPDGFAPAANFDKRKATGLRAGRLINFRRELFAVSALEVKFQSELKLTRIECRGRLAVVMAVACSLAEGIYNLVKGVGRGFVEAIEEIESFSDDVQTQPFTEMDLPSEPSVKREIAMRDTHVATQGSVGRKDALQTTGINAGRAQSAVREQSWAFVSALKVAIGISDGQDVERTTRRNLDNRRQRKTSQERFESTRGFPIIGCGKHATKNEAMSLVE